MQDLPRNELERDPRRLEGHAKLPSKGSRRAAIAKHCPQRCGACGDVLDAADRGPVCEDCLHEINHWIADDNAAAAQRAADDYDTAVRSTTGVKTAEINQRIGKQP